MLFLFLLAAPMVFIRTLVGNTTTRKKGGRVKARGKKKR